MRVTSRLLLSLSLCSAVVVGLGGCAVLERLGVDIPSGPELTADALPGSASPEVETTPAEETLTEMAPEGLAVPGCDTLYSPELTTALMEELRVNQGDTSEGSVGFGTTNAALAGLLSAVRFDLKISCTWYLPDSESVSVSSIAIVGGDTASSVENVLRALDATQTGNGAGILWDLEQTASQKSPDFIATEAHFLVDTPCPSSLAEAACAVWVSTNYTFGQAHPLTIDAAAQLGVLGE
jgi:hypothetical protein